MKNRNYYKKSRKRLKGLYNKRSARTNELWQIISTSRKFNLRMGLDYYRSVMRQIIHEETEKSKIWYLLYNRKQGEEEETISFYEERKRDRILSIGNLYHSQEIDEYTQLNHDILNFLEFVANSGEYHNEYKRDSHDNYYLKYKASENWESADDINKTAKYLLEEFGKKK